MALYWITGRCPQCGKTVSVQSSRKDATVAHLPGKPELHGWKPKRPAP